MLQLLVMSFEGTVERKAATAAETSFDAQIVEFYQQYNKDLFYFVFSYVHNENDATDLVQEVFCSAVNHMRKTQKVPEELRGWLFRIARNRAINFKARSVTVKKNFDSLRKKYHRSNEFEGELLNNMLLQDILAYIQEAFSDREFEIFQMRLMHELKLEEIKLVTGLSNATISRIAENVIEKIRQKFGDDVEKLTRLLFFV